MRVLIVLFLLLSASCWPAVYYVANDGDDANDGLDADKPFKTFDQFTDVAADGDTLYAKAGVYTDEDESLDAVFSPTVPNLKIYGYNATTSTLDGTLGCVVLDASVNALNNAAYISDAASDYCLFQYIGFTGAADDGYESISNSIGHTFKYCEAYNNGQRGINGNNYTTFEYCIGHNNASYGLSLGYYGAAYNCIVYGNSVHGMYARDAAIINCIGYDNGAGTHYQIYAYQSSTVIGCTVDGGGTDGGIFATGSYIQQAVYNNIIYDCTNGLYFNSTTYHHRHYNNLYFSTTTNITNDSLGATDVEDIDPLFVDASANDYRLRGFSPALTAGIDAAEIDSITSRSYNHIGALAPSWKPLIHADGGQTITLEVTVVADASVTASSIRIVLDPNNEFGCYSASSYATVDATTVLSASGTVSGSTESLLIPWQLENTAETGVWSVSLAEVEVQ